MATSDLGNDRYKNTSFKEDLDNSDGLVEAVVFLLKYRYPEPEYEVLGSFDNHSDGVVSDFNQSEQNEMFSILSKRFSENIKSESDKYINFNQVGLEGPLETKKGMRSFDVAVRESKSGDIIELVECKDFPQLLYFDKTGLPAFYLKKLNLLKEVLERQQGGRKIKASVVFTDTEFLLKNSLKRNKKKDIYLDKDNQIIPYAYPLEMFLKEEIATKRNGDKIKSIFIKDSWNTNKEANDQLLLRTNSSVAISIDKYFKVKNNGFLVDNVIIKSMLSLLDNNLSERLNGDIRSNTEKSQNPDILYIIEEIKDNLGTGFFDLDLSGLKKFTPELKRAGLDLYNKKYQKKDKVQYIEELNNYAEYHEEKTRVTKSKETKKPQSPKPKF